MIQSLSVSFDNQIFRRQPRGGISRYFMDLRHGLEQKPSIQLTHQTTAQIVHATFYGGRPYRLKRRQRLVSSLYDMIPERHPEHFFLPRWRSPHANKKGWLHASDLILSISQASADDLAFFYPTIHQPIQVIHLATAIASVQPAPIPSLTNRRFWLMVGKRYAYKNGLTVLHALQRIASVSERPLLVCAGGGSLSTTEKMLIQQHGLLNQVIQIPADQHQLAWLYREAEAVLVPSICEGFSLPLIEALVCNTPVLASDLEAHREVASRFATLLPATNVVAWADALATAAQTPMTRPRSALAANAFAELYSYYSLERMASEHQTAYKAICI